MARGVALSQDLRNLIIKAFKEGKSSYQIAKNLFIARSSVQNIISLFKKTGDVKLKRKTGRPSIAKPADYRALKRIIVKNRRETAAAITVEWRNHLKKDISVDTCKRSMKKIGYKFYFRPKKNHI